jgi:hypothetical protein
MSSTCNKGNEIAVQPNWSTEVECMDIGLGSSSPPLFDSFTEWWIYVSKLQQSSNPPKLILVPWKQGDISMIVGHNADWSHRTGNQVEKQTEVNMELLLGGPLHSRGDIRTSPHCSKMNTVHQENPNQAQLTNAILVHLRA